MHNIDTPCRDGTHGHCETYLTTDACGNSEPWLFKEPFVNFDLQAAMEKDASLDAFGSCVSDYTAIVATGGADS
jgi:hypothetical protein